MCLGFFKSTDIAIWRDVAWIKEKAENRESNSDADANGGSEDETQRKQRVISEEDTSGEQKEKHIAKYQPKKRSS